MALEVLTEIFGKAARAIFGSRNERLLRRYWQRVEAINALEAEYEALSDEALLAKTEEFRGRLPRREVEKTFRRYREWIDAATDQREYVRLKQELRDAVNRQLDPLLAEAFAAAREASKRCVWLGHEEAPADYHPDVQARVRQAMRGEAGLVDPATGKPIELHGLYSMRPYDVQLIGAMVLWEGKIAEMVTGEGKTLVASLAAYLNALSGFPVHVVSTNDYLVRVGREWNAPVFRRLGLTVGAIQAGMDSRERKPQYACDIVYGTNNEFGFDYLRDNMKTSASEQVQGELAFAIVDECDSVLVDEARTPLIISGPAFE
jgi:preprotein translocase subunit SecA